MITDLVFEDEEQPRWCEQFFEKFRASQEYNDYQATGDRGEEDDFDGWIDRFCWSLNLEVCVRRVIFQFPTALDSTHCYIFAFRDANWQMQFRLMF